VTLRELRYAALDDGPEVTAAWLPSAAARTARCAPVTAESASDRSPVLAALAVVAT
jgi:hypothetical protein